MKFIENVFKNYIMYELKIKIRIMKWWINEINDKMKIYEFENNKYKWKNDINDKMIV